MPQSRSYRSAEMSPDFMVKPPKINTPFLTWGDVKKLLTKFVYPLEVYETRDPQTGQLVEYRKHAGFNKIIFTFVTLEKNDKDETVYMWRSNAEVFRPTGQRA